MDVEEQRVCFVVEAALGEKPISKLCVAYGVSRPVGHLWLKRYREGGWLRLLGAATPSSSSLANQDGE